MYKLYTIVFVFLPNCLFIGSNQIFHERSKLTFVPDDDAQYFGYSTLLSKSGLLIGAPKAKSRINKVSATGLVFNCSLDDLPYHEQRVICKPLILDDNKDPRRFVPNFFKNDMWFGATMALIPNGNLMVCAPRWATPMGTKHLLANGACYVRMSRRDTPLYPLRDLNHQAFMIRDTLRRDYGDYGSHLNYYAYGQAGFSMKLTKNNTVIMGAPGLLQWTGGLIDYKYEQKPNNIVFFSKRDTSNPYFTMDSAADDYLGYSVDSGIFDSTGVLLYVAGAPRAKYGYGQVIIFAPAYKEQTPLNIKAKIQGPLLGSYFGASLCATDIDGDGRSDLLIGAPTFVKKDGGLPFDQGAVFIYMTKSDKVSGISLESCGYVSGSGESGARFGNTIADLGDIDDDGFSDIAIGAPWENDGVGAVYIYKGYEKGLRSEYVQRITAVGAKSFGISISKGLDIDNNNCSDLAIGAHDSESAYIYRCIPTIEVYTCIKVPEAMDLPQNATNFTAIFCVSIPFKVKWPYVKIDLNATIVVDKEESRAYILGDSELMFLGSQPGNERCEELIVEVKPTADLSRPISIKFDVLPILSDNYDTYSNQYARLSEKSVLHSEFDIQLTRGCGKDLICKPWLEMTLKSFSNPYVPGTENKLGFQIIVVNKEEPAYGAKVNLTLPVLPKRIPQACALQELNMTCDVRSPLHMMESVTWDIELENSQSFSENKNFTIKAELKDTLYRNITDQATKELIICITPKANFTLSGKALLNTTIAVSRERYNQQGNVTFTHYFEVTNKGPSDWPKLLAHIDISNNVNLSSPVKGCELFTLSYIECSWSLPANVSMPIILPLRYDLNSQDEQFEKEMMLNISTNISLILENGFKSWTVTTTLVLEPAPPLWILVAGVLAGVLLLAILIYSLYKCGFFSRQRREDLRRLMESQEDIDKGKEEGCSSDPDHSTVNFSFTESCAELIDSESD